MAELDYEEISLFLPRYLSPDEQHGLFEEIKRFPEKRTFYDLSDNFKDSTLQGDGWRGLIAIDFQTLEKKNVSGVVISNSCDIAVENQHDHSPNILFAPIIPLAKFSALLKQNGVTDASIEEKLDVIRRQRITSLFYLPKCESVIDESIIVLDDIHRHPLDNFVKIDKAKLFTLTQLGFYLFLIKLSIHFHRVNEGVHRFIPEATASVSA